MNVVELARIYNEGVEEGKRQAAQPELDCRVSLQSKPTTPPAAQQDIQRLSALVRAQQITIDKLEAAQPAVPDAFGTREGEHPQYIQGWNDCRAEVLRERKS